MKKMRNGMIALAAVLLLAVGVVAIAGNGFGENAEWSAPASGAGNRGLRGADAAGGYALSGRDADGDGICNSEDPDWVRPADGTGYGRREGRGLNRANDRSLDGSGFGAGYAPRAGHRSVGCCS
jgi:hypothetical protein